MSSPGSSTRPATPPRVIFIAILAGFSGLLYGYDSGSISGALGPITTQFNLSADSQGLITSLLLYGALPSIVASTFLSRRFDRRQILLVGGVIFIVGSIGLWLATSPQEVMIWRFILGFAVGIANMFGLIYLSELAPTHIRGLLTALYQLAVNIGILGAYTVGAIFEPQGMWQVVLGAGVFPALIFFVGMLIAPPSPRFLVTRGKDAKALEVLTSLRPTAAIAQAEVDEIKEAANATNVGLRELFRTAGPALKILVVLTFLQVFTGINAVVYYAPIIFENTQGLFLPAGTLASFGVGIALVISTAASLPLIDKLGRVKLLAISFAGQAITMLVLWIFPESGWLSIVAVFLYTLSFGFGLGPVFWLYVPEVLPLRMRSIGMGVITFTQYLFNAFFAQMFPLALQGIGPIVFGIFALLSAFGVFYVLRFVPETSGRSLEEIEERLRK